MTGGMLAAQLGGTPEAMINVCSVSPWHHVIPAISMPRNWLTMYLLVCGLGIAGFLVSTALFVFRFDNRWMPALNAAGLAIVTAHFLASAATARYRAAASESVEVQISKHLFAAALINGLAATFYLDLWPG